jgi:hypothetical protein
MWRGQSQSITDYKKNTSPVADIDVLLPDNFFARFEDNTMPLTRPATRACGLSFSVANVSKTFQRVHPRKAAGPDDIPSRVSSGQEEYLECCSFMWSAQRITGGKLSALQDTYSTRCHRKPKISSRTTTTQATACSPSYHPEGKVSKGASKLGPRD